MFPFKKSSSGLAVAGMAAACVLSLASCNENATQTPLERPFEFKGASYVTLQEAFDAVAAAGVGTDSLNCIRLLSDASGNGATMPEEYIYYLEWDLGGYAYTLEDGSIDACLSGLYVKGNGGRITSRSASLPAFKAEGDFLYFMDKLTVEAPFALESSADVYFDDFQGRFEGNMTITSALVTVLPSKGHIHIPELNIEGEDVEDACFWVQTESAERIVSIDKLSSALPYPVCTDVDGAVSIESGGEVHVHHFAAAVEYPSDCIHEAWEEHSCSECGAVKRNRLSTELGTCPTEKLVHYAASEAKPPLCGNIEYWECPLCHKRYTDPGAENELTGSPVILAENYLVPDSLLHPIDDWHWQDDASATKAGKFNVFTTSFGLFLSSWGTGLSIYSLQDNGTTRKLTDFLEKIDNLQQEVDMIHDCMVNFYRSIKVQNYTEELVKQEKGVYELFNESFVRLQEMEKLGNDTAKILTVVKRWADGPLGSKQNFNNLQTLLNRIKKFTTNGRPMIETLYEATSLCRVWEHECYDFIYQELTTELVCLMPALMMAGYYMENIDDDSDYVKENDFKELTDNFLYLYNTLTAAKEIMKERDKMRVYMFYDDQLGHGTRAYSKDCPSCMLNMQWMLASKDFSVKNQDKATHALDGLWQNMTSGKSCITWDEARNIMDFDKHPNHPDISMEEYLVNELGFRSAEGYPFTLLEFFCDHPVAYRMDANGEDWYYRIFHWTSHGSLHQHIYAEKFGGGYEKIFKAPMMWCTMTGIDDIGFAAQVETKVQELCSKNSEE